MDLNIVDQFQPIIIINIIKMQLSQLLLLGDSLSRLWSPSVLTQVGSGSLPAILSRCETR